MLELRYSRTKFKTTFLVAVLLTMMISAMAWMIFIRLGVAYSSVLTALVALIFFVFCSIGMLWRYYHDEVVFAVRRTGLFDKRWRGEIINWEDIKEVVLLQRETDFLLEVHLWPASNSGAQDRSIQPLKIDLTPFDVTVEAVAQAIGNHVPIRLDAVTG